MMNQDESVMKKAFIKGAEQRLESLVAIYYPKDAYEYFIQYNFDTKLEILTSLNRVFPKPEVIEELDCINEALAIGEY